MSFIIAALALASIGAAPALASAPRAPAASEPSLAEHAATAPLLTKTVAYELLKSQGIRWHQTELLPLDAESLRIQAEAALQPHMGFAAREMLTRTNLRQFGFTESGPMDLITFGAAVAEFEIPVFDLKSRARADAAKMNETLTRENMRQFQSDLTYGMLLTFVNTQRLAEKLKVIESNIGRNGEILKMAEAKLRSGAGISIDVMRAKGLVALENMRKLETETNYRKSLRDLATMLGLPAIEGGVEPLTLNEIDIDAKDKFAKTGVDDRPDVKAAELTVLAAKEIKNEAESEFDPKVTMLGDVGVGGVSLIQGEGANLLGTIAIQVKFPIFDGHFFGAKVQQSQVSVSKAVLQAQHTRLDAESQIYNALDQLETSRTAAALASEQVKLATEELNIARRRFTSGSTSGVDLASSQGNLSNALNNYIDIVFGYEASKVNYFKSIGEFETYFALEKKKK